MSVGPQPKLNSPRYDAQTVKEALALAGRLQDEHRSMMSVEQIEAVAAEVGVDPAFVSQALDYLEKKPVPVAPPRPARQEQEQEQEDEESSPVWSKGKIVGLWWAVGWIAPAVVAVPSAHTGHDFVSVCAMGYVAGGIALSILLKPGKSQRKTVLRETVHRTVSPTARATESVSREALLQTLFALQKQLDQGKKKRAFLSIDVVGSTQMKRTNSELASEYSFGQYRRWLEERVRAEGGLLHSAAGDGTMCVFENEEIAERVAQMLISDLPRFNREQNHLNQPFQIRCGVSEGEIAIEPGAPIGAWQSSVIDRAAVLQKEAAPNTVIVGSRTGGL